MHKVTLYYAGGPRALGALESVALELGAGGITTAETRGAWRDDSGEIVAERAYRSEILSDGANVIPPAPLARAILATGEASVIAEVVYDGRAPVAVDYRADGARTLDGRPVR